MMSMELYNAVREVPENAKKQIGGGRLKGMTDINPMWRIQKLTEQFGICGFGWKYEITGERIVDGANGEKAAFVDISLYIKMDGEWSAAIPGTGGSAFIANERGGAYTSDECFKMALTDAISVACKALGFGADVYWQGGRTKYTAQGTAQSTAKKPVCELCGSPIGEMANDNGKVYSPEQVAKASLQKYGKVMCGKCRLAADKK